MMIAGEGYAGGGSGGYWGAGTPQPGPVTSGKDGEANTGGGGGGASRNNDSVRGGHGGSGIVLIAYPT